MQTEQLLPDQMGLARAAILLAGGDVVAIPTETVYGLAGDARNGQAVARIYAAKGRPSFNPLIVHVPDLDAARPIAQITPEAEALAEAEFKHAPRGEGAPGVLPGRRHREGHAGGRGFRVELRRVGDVGRAEPAQVAGEADEDVHTVISAESGRGG